MNWYPLRFEPIIKERVWGGSQLSRLYGKNVPNGMVAGESWEMTDRPEGVSQIINGPLRGNDLRWLMEKHERALLGEAKSANGRFPLLLKILDANDKLSLQVHPPASKAAALGGEPKTEMWYVAHSAPGAELYVGLRKRASKEEFVSRLKDGTVAESFHRVPVETGDVMFLPSGRVHALGAGLVIFEIQQNSDTTYRVFDWNRVGLDGKPRELHVEQSLQCIDFNDFEPGLVKSPVVRHADWSARELANNSLFRVELWKCTLDSSRTAPVRKAGTMQIIGMVAGQLSAESPFGTVTLRAGDFCLLPATLTDGTVTANGPAKFLLIEAAC